MKTPLCELIDIWINQMPDEDNISVIEVDWHEFMGIFAELLEKEKQMIIDAHYNGYFRDDTDELRSLIDLHTEALQYYNKTFKTLKQ